MPLPPTLSATDVDPRCGHALHAPNSGREGAAAAGLDPRHDDGEAEGHGDPAEGREDRAGLRLETVL